MQLPINSMRTPSHLCASEHNTVTTHTTERCLKLNSERHFPKKASVIFCEAGAKEWKHAWGNACIQTRARPNLPVRNNTRVVTLLVLIHFHIAHENKGSVSPVGADHASACDGLRKMRIYRRPTDRLQSLKLSRRGYIKSLERKSGREIYNLLLQQQRTTQQQQQQHHMYSIKQEY